ncbi:regulatory iron-sulfur-containing complex subunit RicT [uncultured Prevotella sp.]|uniref:PSP1 domain-containing protein n=1 Tax=uncultured Prevotella sp. TaxID=159272 RepID=UPI00266ED2F8|nr:regulatory iron-sulfur-containing complex subunit RicT [uncultured Prevotella sp.]
MKEFKDMQFHISRDTDRGLCHCACGRQDRQLNTYDWLYDVPGNEEDTDLVEVQFKNTRKGYYHNVNHLDLQKGDTVAVEANPGHDIGVVTLTGRLVKLQVKKANLKSPDEIKRVYRIAKPTDMDKYYEAKSREHGTMIQSRQIAKDLGLQMKIGDVEYQGDGNKAIFYYIADERVDFRQLIKVLADTFHVRIEMKQIGARQEAGRIGGTGPCGRELCCATWMKNFVSVSTNAARIQDISLNPQKLAGMCAKLKCCLNYEVDDYVEAGRKMPARDVVLQTADSDWYLFKTDILAGLVTYSTDKSIAANLITISAERARAVIEMNRRGEKPEALDEGDAVNTSDRPADLLADADISRFDKAKKKKKAKNRPNRQQQPANNQQREPKQPKQREQRQPKSAPADMQQQPRPQAQQYHKPQGQQPKPQGQHPQQPRPQGQQQKQQANQQGQQQPKPQHPAKPQAQQPKQQPQANADVQK